MHFYINNKMASNRIRNENGTGTQGGKGNTNPYPPVCQCDLKIEHA